MYVCNHVSVSMCVCKSLSTYHDVKVKELQNSLVAVKAKKGDDFFFLLLPLHDSFTENNFLAPQFFRFTAERMGKGIFMDEIIIRKNEDEIWERKSRNYGWGQQRSQVFVYWREGEGANFSFEFSKTVNSSNFKNSIQEPQVGKILFSTLPGYAPGWGVWPWIRWTIKLCIFY